MKQAQSSAAWVKRSNLSPLLVGYTIIPTLSRSPGLALARYAGRTRQQGDDLAHDGQSEPERVHKTGMNKPTRTLFALLGLCALAGCEGTPATGAAPRTSYPTDQTVYTGPQEYRPESYPDPEYPFYPTTQSPLPGLQLIPQPSN
jgi:hypothetical protein